MGFERSGGELVALDPGLSALDIGGLATAGILLSGLAREAKLPLLPGLGRSGSRAPLLATCDSDEETGSGGKGGGGGINRSIVAILLGLESSVEAMLIE